MSGHILLQPGYEVKRRGGTLTVVKTLGRGSFGCAYLAYNDKPQLYGGRAVVVLKVFRPDAALEGRDEARYLQKVRGETDTCVKMLDSFSHTCRSKSLFVVVMQAARCSLQDVVRDGLPVLEGPLFFAMARRFLLGLDRLNVTVGVLHLDLKPENLLVSYDSPEQQTEAFNSALAAAKEVALPPGADPGSTRCHEKLQALPPFPAGPEQEAEDGAEGHNEAITLTATSKLLIADFNVSRRVAQGVPEQECGTEGYLAPEMVLQFVAPHDQDLEMARRVDVFGATVSLLEIATKQTVFPVPGTASFHVRPDYERYAQLAQLEALTGPLGEEFLERCLKNGSFYTASGGLKSSTSFGTARQRARHPVVLPPTLDTLLQDKLATWSPEQRAILSNVVTRGLEADPRRRATALELAEMLPE